MTEAAAAPDGGQAGADGGQAGAADNGGQATDWRIGLAEDVRGYAENKGWSDPGAVVESYRNLEKLHGVPQEQLLKLPKPGADPAEWAPVWDRLGRPADPKDYVIPMPEGQEDTTFADWARGKFHEIGLPAKMAEQLVTEWNQFIANMGEQSTTQYNDAVAAEDQALKKDWGQAYEQNIGRAKIAAQNLGIDGETIDALESSMGFAKVMKLFHDIGTKMGEGEFVGDRGDTSFGGKMTPTQAQQQLTSLSNNKAWVQKFAEGDPETRAEHAKLMKAAYPDETTV